MANHINFIILLIITGARFASGSPDILFLKNGDRIHGEFKKLNGAVCEFQTLYQASLIVGLEHIQSLSTGDPVTIHLVTGERLIGNIVIEANKQITVESHLLGSLKIPFEQVVYIIRSNDDLQEKSKLVNLIGKGDQAGDKLKEKGALKQSSQQSIGENPDEDLRHVFLRDSTVLLKPVEFEIEIGFNYRRDANPLADVFSGLDERRRVFTAPLNIRAGLTKGFESFFTLPLIYAQNESIEAGEESDEESFGLGDVSSGLKYLLMEETLNWPDVVISIAFSAPTGSNPFDDEDEPVFLGRGHWTPSGGLQFIKTVDPCVLFWGIEYSHDFGRQFDQQEIQPGEVVGYNFGMGFAVNPNMTLSWQFQGEVQSKTTIDGVSIPGSSREPMSLRFGVTNRFSKRQFVEPSVLFGLNDDAPDVAIGVSYNYRFW